MALKDTDFQTTLDGADPRQGDWGLCRSRYEKDSCGFGLIASLDDRATHWVLQTAISSLNRLTHRGAIATDGNEDIQHHADDVIYVPKSPAFLQAALAILPLQLLAYRIARLRGLNVDQPRNLAKTVTVE